MITYVTGDLFTSPAKVLVNTVNTVGVMGKGIAKTFKAVYPEMFRRYQTLCEEGRLTVGTLWLYKTPHKWILNFPTKKHWRQPSRPEYVEAGLQKFVATCADQGIASIAFPRLGCGNGELDWDAVVQPLMREYLDNLPIDVFVYHYDVGVVVPEHRDQAQMNAWLRGEPRTLAFDEIWNDLSMRIGEGLRLRSWDAAVEFRVSLLADPIGGLRIQMGGRSIWKEIAERIARVMPQALRLRVRGPGDIEIPREAILELWQNVRAYGFCVARIMPSGLDAIAPQVMSITALLDYMKPVQLDMPSARTGPTAERGLQLFPATAPPGPVPAGEGPQHSVQAA